MYDKKKKGYLERDELRTFINEIRESIGLTTCDDDIFIRIHKILDINGDNQVEPYEMLEKFSEILPILSECDQHRKKLIEKAFHDFDLDDKGYQNLKELRLLFDLQCDRMRVKRCSNWKFTFIKNLIDDDKNGQIELEEFINNYRFINEELMKNHSKKMKNKKDDDFFQEGFHKKVVCENKQKQDLMSSVSFHSKKIKASVNSFKQLPTTNFENYFEEQVEEKLNNIMPKISMNNAKKFLPLNSLMNNNKDELFSVNKTDNLSFMSDKENTPKIVLIPTVEAGSVMDESPKEYDDIFGGTTKKRVSKKKTNFSNFMSDDSSYNFADTSDGGGFELRPKNNFIAVKKQSNFKRNNCLKTDADELGNCSLADIDLNPRESKLINPDSIYKNPRKSISSFECINEKQSDQKRQSKVLNQKIFKNDKKSSHDILKQKTESLINHEFSSNNSLIIKSKSNFFENQENSSTKKSFLAPKRVCDTTNDLDQNIHTVLQDFKHFKYNYKEQKNNSSFFDKYEREGNAIYQIFDQAKILHKKRKEELTEIEALLIDLKDCARTSCSHVHSKNWSKLVKTISFMVNNFNSQKISNLRIPNIQIPNVKNYTSFDGCETNTDRKQIVLTNKPKQLIVDEDILKINKKLAGLVAYHNEIIHEKIHSPKKFIRKNMSVMLNLPDSQKKDQEITNAPIIKVLNKTQPMISKSESINQRTPVKISEESSKSQFFPPNSSIDSQDTNLFTNNIFTTTRSIFYMTKKTAQKANRTIQKSGVIINLPKKATEELNFKNIKGIFKNAPNNQNSMHRSSSTKTINLKKKAQQRITIDMSTALSIKKACTLI